VEPSKSLNSIERLVAAIKNIGLDRVKTKPKAFHAHFEPREDRNCMVGWDGARAQRT
jgi:hypothetical protein